MKKVLKICLVLLMFLGFAGVSDNVYAASEEKTQSEFDTIDGNPFITITKQLKVRDEHIYPPEDAVFTFAIYPTDDFKEQSQENLPIQEGPFDGLAVFEVDDNGHAVFDEDLMKSFGELHGSRANVKFEYEDLTDVNKKGDLPKPKNFTFDQEASTWNLSVNVGINTEAFEREDYGVGVYRYLLHESGYAAEGADAYRTINELKYSSEVYIIDVFKLRNEKTNDFEYKLCMYKEDFTEYPDPDNPGIYISSDPTLDITKKYYAASFTNDWSGETGDYGTRHIILRNKVTGDMGDQTKSFEYTVKIFGQGNEFFAYRKKGSGQWKILRSCRSDTGQPSLSIALTGDEFVEFMGIGLIDKMDVEQKDETEDGYSTTVSMLVTDKTTNTETLWVQPQNQLAMTVDTWQDTILEFKNDRNIGGVTGLTIESIPYLLAALSGLIVFVLVFNRRKSSRIEE